MTTSGVEQRENNRQPAPTELHLFTTTQPDIENSKNAYSNATHFRRIFDTANESLRKAGKLHDQRRDRLNVDIANRDDVVRQYKSYCTVSAAYLAINDKYSSMGLSREEIKEVFLRMLDSNIDFHERYSYKPDRSRTKQQKEVDYKSGQYRARVVSFAGDKPGWFKGNTLEWHKYFYENYHFDRLFKEENRRRENETELGYVSKDSMPDWIEEIDTTAPQIEDVQEELSQDSQDQELVAADFNDRYASYEKFRHYYRAYPQKRIANFEGRRRNFATDSKKTFPGLLSYLGRTEEDILEYSASPEELLTMEWEERHRNQIPPLKSREKIIREAAYKEPVYHQMVAVWFEKKLKEAGLSASSTVDDELIRRLGLYKESDSEELERLKSTDKKFHNAFKYEIKPFLSSMDEEDRKYYDEVLENAKGQALEVMIWEIAYLAVKQINSKENPELKKKEEDIRKLTASWIASNWKYAYGELEKAATGLVARHEFERENEVETEQDLEEEQEKEAEIMEVVRGNLDGWRVFYTGNRKVKDGDLIEVEGETLEDREKTLGEVLLKEGGQVAVKTSSIVGALDWAVGMPKEVYVMRPKMEVNGEEFTKFKRGGARILMQMDRNNKQVYFFLHQKKAMSYGF